MNVRLGALLRENAVRTFAGRDEELATLLKSFEAGQPPVWFVEGIAGIGKSRLLDQLARQVARDAIRVTQIDCRTVEPTAESFLIAVAGDAGDTAPDLDAVIERIAGRSSQTLLILDAYESFQLLDSWMRMVFLPRLPEGFRVVFGSRLAPGPGWLSAPEWTGLFQRMTLGPLPEADALAMLSARGVEPELARRINRVAQGHPLALQLVAATPGDGLSAIRRIESETIPAMIARLARVYLTDVPDRRSRRLLEAASVVRRMNRPLIAVMLPEEDAGEALDLLEQLPFVDRRADGLIVNEAVQSAIAAWLQATDPEQHLALRRRAWRHLRSRDAAAGDLWSVTADLLFMLQNPLLRDGFFPSGGSACQASPSRPEDWAGIEAICRAHEGPEAMELLAHFWETYPDAFGTVWDERSEIAGYAVAIATDAVDRSTLQRDPVIRAWLRHLERHPLPSRQRALLGRTWLGRDAGERPSAAQAAIWIDAKRLYMEMRPQLRRMYICQRDFSHHEEALAHLGFVDLPDATAEIDGMPYHTRMLDFGPGSVDGWLAGLVAAELGIEENGLLVPTARAVSVGGAEVRLTKLEFGVMQLLTARQGQVVSRTELLAEVWGTDYDGGSNVVDAVIRGLRKKLGSRAAELETVRGAGYRLNGA
jgi:hypothetical protein